MNLSIPDALRMLDEADPAEAFEPGANDGSAWQQFVELRDDVATIEVSPPMWRSTRPLLIAATVVAVLVAAVALAWADRRGSTNQPGAAQSSFPTSAVQARTIGLSVLDSLAEPRGTRASSEKFGPSIPCSPDCAIATETLSVPGGVHAALDFYAKHLPKGFAVVERGATSLRAAGDPSSSEAGSLAIDMAGRGARTAVRIVVSEPWYSPNRSPGEYIPAGSASVVATFGSSFLSPKYPAKTVQRTLSSVQAQNVVRAVNTAPTWNPEDPRTCTTLPKYTTLTIVITVGGHRYLISEFGGYCRVQVARDGVALRALDVDLAPTVLRDLGVPTR